MEALTAAWERYAAGRTPRRAVNAAGATTWLNWTQYPDHGPDESLLGPVRGLRVLELGCGTGCNLAHLANLGARCVGIDIVPSQRTKADIVLRRSKQRDAPAHSAGTSPYLEAREPITAASHEKWHLTCEILTAAGSGP
ncbi:methyltransferase [Streptomyces sp. NBRC 110611]|uniref:class I SAM-dependent methyltransferase n=1 Tax=Streptomyces sp. NBRC 110611 TaxID=1621259 RepID=UPI000857C752|nr:methyltransferase domain-containing protein [Streptomyces sp. NBRC 110611]GAU68551.1 methyltransferase [Streptomyces sp. NBRC 110611]